MKINYRIIWVEDKLDTRPYIAIKNDLKEFLENEFFDCEIEVADDFDEFQKLFNVNKTYDLIITDLSLNNGSTGKQVIDYIRENKHNHTEVFFYSANTKLKHTDLLNSNRITFYQLTEGNYKELKEEIKELIALTISKFQHIVSMRGMIMHETSLLDVEMKEIATKVLKEGSEKIDEVIKRATENGEDFFGLEEIKQQMFDSIKQFTKEKKDKADSEKLKEILKDDVLFSAGQRCLVIGLILKALNLKDFSADYKNQIIWYRNQFAHAPLLIDNEGKEFFKVKKPGTNEDVVFNDVLCKEIRNNIISHKKNLDKLSKILFPS